VFEIRDAVSRGVSPGDAVSLGNISSGEEGDDDIDPVDIIF
jgi:hypothetical protein